MDLIDGPTMCSFGLRPMTIVRGHEGWARRMQVSNVVSCLALRCAVDISAAAIDEVWSVRASEMDGCE